MRLLVVWNVSSQAVASPRLRTYHELVRKIPILIDSKQLSPRFHRSLWSSQIVHLKRKLLVLEVNVSRALLLSIDFSHLNDTPHDMAVIGNAYNHFFKLYLFYRSFYKLIHFLIVSNYSERNKLIFFVERIMTIFRLDETYDENDAFDVCYYIRVFIR